MGKSFLMVNYCEGMDDLNENDVNGHKVTQLFTEVQTTEKRFLYSPYYVITRYVYPFTVFTYLLNY